jgi:hypothetical protein
MHGTSKPHWDALPMRQQMLNTGLLNAVSFPTVTMSFWSRSLVSQAEAVIDKEIQSPKELWVGVRDITAASIESQNVTEHRAYLKDRLSFLYNILHRVMVTEYIYSCLQVLKCQEAAPM